MTVVPDEASLLASIAAAPLDDAPKLVYADWLQEHGADANAEYLRLVVRLMHPPEESSAVERCVDLGNDLDAKWCQAVGGYFEVALAGADSVLMLAFLFKTVLGLAFDEPIELWQQGEPVCLRRSLTREAAGSFVRRYAGPLMNQFVQARLTWVIRPMTSESPPQLFAPDTEKH